MSAREKEKAISAPRSKDDWENRRSESVIGEELMRDIESSWQLTCGVYKTVRRVARAACKLDKLIDAHVIIAFSSGI